METLKSEREVQTSDEMSNGVPKGSVVVKRSMLTQLQDEVTSLRDVSLYAGCKVEMLSVDTATACLFMFIMHGRLKSWHFLYSIVLQLVWTR